MNIFLSGGGNADRKTKFDQYFKEHIGSREIIIIPYAGVPNLFPEKDVRDWLEEHESFKDIDYKFLYTNEEISKIDPNQSIVMIPGGNTYQLLHHLREKSGLTALQKLIMQGLAFYGHSAGSIIAGVDIDTASYPPECDKNDVAITDFLSMNILNGYNIATHFSSDQHAVALDHFKKSLIPIIGIAEEAGAHYDGELLISVGSEPLCVVNQDGISFLENGESMKV